MEDRKHAEGDGLIELTATPSTRCALRGVVNTIDVLVQVKTQALAPQEGQPKRAPLNLAIVLDRSGSMQGKKLENAKAAIVQVVQSLASTDVLHLVSYGSDVTTIFENGSMAEREKLIEQIKAIETNGCTNLWGGMERGAQLLVAHQQEHQKEIEFASRLFLFSDGLVNEGIQDKKVIQNKTSEIYQLHRVQVSAFGVGNDFDEELMKGIAEYGNGAYFFIEGADAIPAFVSFALKYTLETLASNAVVKVRGINAGLVKKFYSEHHDLLKGARLGDLRADNVRTVLLQMEVRGDVTEAEQDVLSCELTFKKKDAEEEKEVETSIVKTVTLRFTNDAEDVETARDPDVVVKVVVQQTGEIDKEMVKVLDGKGNGKTKAAIELLEKQVELLEGVVDIDNNVLEGKNKIASLLEKAEKSLKDLRERGATKEARKEAHHRGYMKSRG